MRLTRTDRRLLAIGAVLVAAIAGTAVWLGSSQRAVALADTRRATANLGQVLAEQTARTLLPVDLTLRQIQDRMEKTGPDIVATLGSAATFTMLADRLKGLPQADALVLVGADGRLANSTRGFPPRPFDLSGRDMFRYFSTHDDRTIYVSQPVKTLATGAWTVYFGRRINGPPGVFAGYAGAAFTLASLEDFYAAVTPRHGSVTLLRRDGMILVHYPHIEPGIGIRLPPEAPWYSVLAEGGGSYRSPGYLTGVPGFFAVRPLRDFPLVIDASTSEAAALNNSRRQVVWLAIGAVVAIGCVIVLLRVFSLQFGRLEQQNRQLETGRRQFDAVLDAMSQGLTFFRSHTLIVCNRRYRDIYRLSPEQAREGTMLEEVLRHRAANGSFPDMDAAEYMARRDALCREGHPFDLIDELRDGRTIAMHFQPMREAGWVATHEDITERRRAEERLVFMARHDGLTELPNRTLFHERLADAVALTRPGTHCAVLCLDLDGFKTVNDTLGHPVGDALLQAVAQRLCGEVRDIDTVARLGGDEFAIIQVGIESADAAAGLAERIIRLIHQPYDFDGERVVVGISLGITLAPGDGTAPDILLKSADTALCLAKLEGRGTYRFFEPDMNARLHGRRVLELDLRKALPADDFSLHYQPMLNVASGKVVAFEALIRWNHPDRGMVHPIDFISIAEDTGLIVPIGAWALLRACREAAAWPGDVSVAVNLSSAQFKGVQLLSVVQEALAASGLEPRRLILEITESVLLHKNDAQQALLHRFRALGIGIALDDFGTGYSSLSYLCGFPFDTIKIDQTFVRDLGTREESKVIVGAIIELARGLGMASTAEGVETSGQLAVLRTLGCTTVQGYLFSRPVPAAAAPGLIESLRALEDAGGG